MVYGQGTSGLKKVIFGLCLALLHSASCQLECECPVTLCPDAWITFRGSCYYLSDNVSVDWTEAAHHCSIHGGHLVTIETAEENAFLIDQYKRMYRTASLEIGQEFWIGASDEMIEGVWTWYTSNKSLSSAYKDWYPGQPANDGVDEDCAVIAYRPDKTAWHDAPCSAQHHPICEISAREEGLNEIVG